MPRLLIEILHGISIEGKLPNAVLETSYSAQLTARNAVLPLLWEKVGGDWPPTGGWTIDSATGEVTGDADDAGLYEVTIMVTDGAGQFGQKTFHFRIAAAPLVFAGDLPDATVGDSAAYSYTISGGVGTKTVSLVAGALPAGASIDSAGNVTGTYTTGATYSWMLRVVDGEGTEAFLEDSVTVAWPTLVSTGSLTGVNAGGPVGGSITLSGGNGSYSVEADPISGTRPTGHGLVLSGAVYSDPDGACAPAGTYVWTERFHSGDGQTLDVGCAITVAAIPKWDDVIAALGPIVWIKMSEASDSALVSDGNFGSGGGAISVAGTAPTFGSTPLMPSEPSRTTVNVGAGNGTVIITSLTSANLTSTASIYCIYKGTTGADAKIAWRNRPSGQWFINFTGTNCAMRIRGSSFTTSYANANILDGNPHLIGVQVSASSVSLWVDGSKVWTGSVGGSTSTTNAWNYMSNSDTFASQKPYGNFGDFVIFSDTLSDSDHEAIFAAYLGVPP